MTECTWTERIESAARRDSLDVDELAHARACADCRGLAETIRLLRAEGRSAERSALGRAPSARALYAQAERLRVAQSVGDALRPIVWLERAIAVVGILTAVAAGWWLVARGDNSSGVASLAASLESYPSAAAPDVVSTSMWVAVLTALAVAWYGLAGLSGTTRWR